MGDYQPLVSIITPSYNREWIIQTCINSIKKQSYQNIEHIVIDGRSTDDTVKILEENQKDYNLRWISEKDGGMYDAINKGFKMARGQIVAYLNSDDFYLPYTVQIVVKKYKECPDASVVYGDWLSYYMDTGFLEVLPVLKFDKFDLAKFACLPQPAVFFRRGLLEKVGYLDISYKLLADNEFFTRVAINGWPIKKIDEFLAGQIIHEGNLLAGNDNSIKQADQEASRYRAVYWSALEQKTGKSYNKNAKRSLLKFRLHGYFFRLRLIEFFVRLIFQVPGKWNNFLRIFPYQKVSWINLVRYIFSRKRGKGYQYCINREFIQNIIDK